MPLAFRRVLERKGKEVSRKTREQPRLGQSFMVIPLPRGGDKPQNKDAKIREGSREFWT